MGLLQSICGLHVCACARGEKKINEVGSFSLVIRFSFVGFTICEIGFHIFLLLSMNCGGFVVCKQASVMGCFKGFKPPKIMAIAMRRTHVTILGWAADG